jgi:hypothetical protein
MARLVVTNAANVLGTAVAGGTAATGLARTANFAAAAASTARFTDAVGAIRISEVVVGLIGHVVFVTVSIGNGSCMHVMGFDQ